MLYSFNLDGQTYYFDRDLYPELYNFVTSANFNPQNPDDKALALTALQSLRSNYFVMDSANFRGRNPDDVKDRLPTPNPLKVYGTSSFTLQPDENAGTYNHTLDQIYGVAVKKFPQIVAGYADPTMRCSTNSTHFVILNLPTIGQYADKYHLEYTWHSGYKNADSVDGALSFIEHFKPKIHAAAEIVAAGNPDLDVRLIELNLMSLIFLESRLYDDTDVKQDLAVLGQASSPWAQPFYDAFTGFTSPLNWFLTTSVGYKAYSAASEEMIAIHNQGFGPLQIIPNLIKAAWQVDSIRERYKPHLPDNFDPNNDAILIAALFDPESMFILKAMTFDLECQNIRKLEGVVVPFISPPFLTSVDDAKSLAIAHGAFHLVQIPEDTDFIYGIYNQPNSSGVSFNFSSYVTDLGIMALMMTDSPNIGFDNLQLRSEQDSVDQGVAIALIQRENQNFVLWSQVWFDQQ